MRNSDLEFEENERDFGLKLGERDKIFTKCNWALLSALFILKIDNETTF